MYIMLWYFVTKVKVDQCFKCVFSTSVVIDDEAEGRNGETDGTEVDAGATVGKSHHQ